MTNESDNTIDIDLNKRLAQFADLLAKRQAEVRATVAAAPPSIPCDRHPGQARPIRFSKTCRASIEAGTPTPGYGPCRLCRLEQAARAVRERLERQGVPPIISDCTFDTWKPQNADDQKTLEITREWARWQRKGFLVFLGRVGTGKGHLAVSAMRHFRYGLFLKHSTLLERKRDTYRDPEEPDPVKECQRTAFLVLDEIGVSSGGRDDLPTIQSVLDYRVGHNLPTILTSNLDSGQLVGAIGKRLVDRLRASAYAVRNFGGESWRSKMWGRIFKGKRPE